MTIEYRIGRIRNFIDQEAESNGCARCNCFAGEYLEVDGYLLCTECVAKVWDNEREAWSNACDFVEENTEIELLVHELYLEMTGHSAPENKSIAAILTTTLQWLRLRQGVK